MEIVYEEIQGEEFSEESYIAVNDTTIPDNSEGSFKVAAKGSLI
ncbi:MAG: hypothetical protein U0586_15735 [Candidatus Brocadiaceae bacterium]